MRQDIRECNEIRLCTAWAGGRHGTCPRQQGLIQHDAAAALPRHRGYPSIGKDCGDRAASRRSKRLSSSTNHIYGFLGSQGQISGSTFCQPSRLREHLGSRT